MTQYISIIIYLLIKSKRAKRPLTLQCGYIRIYKTIMFVLCLHYDMLCQSYHNITISELEYIHKLHFSASKWRCGIIQKKH